jgi:hypothetical protein
MKKGRLCEMLQDIFAFVDTRIGRIAKHLQGILDHDKFMDSDALDPKLRKQSTALRWQEQADLVPACKLIKKVGEYYLIKQVVIGVMNIATQKKNQDVTILHIVSLKDFAWADTPENKPPTCCCPANRNVKDVCCGIMFALQQPDNPR